MSPQLPATLSRARSLVPSDIEPESLADLIADCRDMCVGALPTRRVIDLTARVPRARLPEVPAAVRGPMGTAASTVGGTVVVIRDAVVSLVDGFGDYGS